VIANIPVPGFVGQGQSDPITGKAYIPVSTGVAVVDEKTNTVETVITVATNWTITAAAINPLTNLLYVGAQSGGMFVVDARTHRTVGFVNVNAVSIDLDPITNTIYASDFSSTLYVVNGKTNAVETSIPISGIQNIAVNPVTNRIYAAQENLPGNVIVIDGKNNQIVATVAAGGDLSVGVAVDPIHNLFYSSEEFGLNFNQTASTATAYDGKTNTQTAVVQIPGQAGSLVVNPLTQKIYVAGSTDNELNAIDGKTNKLTGNLAVGTNPQYETIDSLRGLVYVGTEDTSDPNNLTGNLAVVKTH